MSNTLDLDPGWGAIDLIEGVEQAFDFTITRDQTERCTTVGDLYAVICAYVPDWDARAGRCVSSMTFYRIRRALDPDRTAAIILRTALAVYGSPKDLLGRMGRETGLRFPTVQLGPTGMIGGLFFTIGTVAALVMLGLGQRTFLWPAVAVAIFGLLPVWSDPGRLPPGIATIGYLVRRTASLYARIVLAAGGKPSSRWEILVSMGGRTWLPGPRRDHAGHRPPPQ